MKKILYATNFSEKSVAALRYTYALRKFFDADMMVLHIQRFSSKMSKAEEKKFLLEQRCHLENFCSIHLGENFENLDLTVAVVKGNSVIKGIKNFIKDMDLHMLVIGACGAGPVRELLLGSAAAEMINQSTFPILTIPRGFQYKTPERILYATDFEEEDIFHIKKLVRIFAPHNLKIIVAHVVQKEQDPNRAKKLTALFKDLKKNTLNYEKLEYKLLFSKNVIEALVNFTNERNIDLVAMLERKNQDQFLHRDVIEQIHSFIKVPMLVFKKGR